MTDENASGSETGTETGSGKENQTESPPSPTASGSGGGKVLAGIALVVSIAAAAVVGYLWYQVQVEQRLSRNQALTDIKNSINTVEVDVQALTKEFEALRRRQQELGSRLETQIQARLDELASKQENLAQRSESLTDSLENVYRDLDRSLDTWALEEVEQLLRIANHSLQLSGDISTTVSALELADKRLEELANPAFLEVRERLANNITALKNLEPVDTAGLSLRLSQIAAKVEDLPLARKSERRIAGKGPESSGARTGESGGETNQWIEAGGEILRDLKQLVRIQNIEETPKPLLAPEQRYFLYHNLSLMFSGAQIAALRKDAATYQKNLDRAAQWIRDYYDTGHQGVQQILSDIEDMSGVELNPELPDISDSLTALQKAKNRMTPR